MKSRFKSETTHVPRMPQGAKLVCQADPTGSIPVIRSICLHSTMDVYTLRKRCGLGSNPGAGSDVSLALRVNALGC